MSLTRQTSVQTNPFWILGVTSRDDRRRIVERAEERSLELDHDLCQNARAALTNPRTRLTAELAWLPGLSPARAGQLTSRILNDPVSICSETGLPALARLNLLTAAFEARGEFSSPDDLANWLLQIASDADRIDPLDVRRDVNEDRTVAGFPQVSDDALLHQELGSRKRIIRDLIRESLDRHPTNFLVDALTRAVEMSTNNGEMHAPALIDDLIDAYETAAHEFLEKEAANVEKLVEAAKRAAANRHRALYKLIERIEIVARNWDRVAQPIQLSAKARGTDHDNSRNLGITIRSLALTLFNEHSLVDEAKRLTSLLQDVFAELPALAERADEDATALHTISKERKEWEEQITYEVEIGTVFRNTLRISPAGISWKDNTYGLDEISRVRWGGTKHSVNGIPTGTTYTVAFGSLHSETVVTFRGEGVFSALTRTLWRAVGIRLATELVMNLKAGHTVHFGELAVSDDAIILKRHRVLRSVEPVRCSWQQVHIWSADGSFSIGSQTDKNTYVVLPYIEVPNVHVLEHVIRIGFKEGISNLSDILQTE